MNKPKYRGCKIEGCKEDHHARGFCNSHYWAWRKDKLSVDPDRRGKIRNGPPPKIEQVTKTNTNLLTSWR